MGAAGGLCRNPPEVAEGHQPDRAGHGRRYLEPAHPGLGAVAAACPGRNKYLGGSGFWRWLPRAGSGSTPARVERHIDRIGRTESRFPGRGGPAYVLGKAAENRHRQNRKRTAGQCQCRHGSSLGAARAVAVLGRAAPEGPRYLPFPQGQRLAGRIDRCPARLGH